LNKVQNKIKFKSLFVSQSLQLGKITTPQNKIQFLTQKINKKDTISPR